MKRLSFILLFTFVWQLHAQRSDFENISFRKADNNAVMLKGEELTNLPQLAFKLTENLGTDVERFRAIYYWVCHNVQSGYGLKEINDRNRYRLKDDFEALAREAFAHDSVLRMAGKYDSRVAISEIVDHYQVRSAPHRDPDSVSH